MGGGWGWGGKGVHPDLSAASSLRTGLALGSPDFMAEPTRRAGILLWGGLAAARSPLGPPQGGWWWWGGDSCSSHGQIRGSGPSQGGLQSSTRHLFPPTRMNSSTFLSCRRQKRKNRVQQEDQVLVLVLVRARPWLGGGLSLSLSVSPSSSRSDRRGNERFLSLITSLAPPLQREGGETERPDPGLNGSSLSANRCLSLSLCR